MQIWYVATLHVMLACSIVYSADQEPPIQQNSDSPVTIWVNPVRENAIPSGFETLLKVVSKTLPRVPTEALKIIVQYCPISDEDTYECAYYWGTNKEWEIMAKSLQNALWYERINQTLSSVVLVGEIVQTAYASAIIHEGVQLYAGDLPLAFLVPAIVFGVTAMTVASDKPREPDRRFVNSVSSYAEGISLYEMARSYATAAFAGTITSTSLIVTLSKRHQHIAKGLFLAGGLYGSIAAITSLFTSCLRSRRHARLLKDIKED